MYGSDSKEYAEEMKEYHENRYNHGDLEGIGGDDVVDADERDGYLSLFSDPNKKDSFNLVGHYGVEYYGYGDNEARCRNAEWNHLEDKYHVELDWCNPGCQHKNVCGPFPEQEFR